LHIFQERAVLKTWLMDRLMTSFFQKMPEKRKTQLTWLALALFIFSAESLFRAVETRLSGNIAHIKGLERSFEEISQASPPRTAFVGNSLTNRGISTAILEANSSQTIIKMVPDGTALWDWQCVIDQFIFSSDPAPVDNLVIGFAWNHLSDQATIDPSRLGGYMCRHQRIFEPESVGLRTFEHVAEFATATTLKLYANRDTIRNRFLDLIIPEYRKYTQMANRSAPQTADASRPEPVATHDQLRKLIAQLKQKNIDAILIAMPVKQPYRISAELSETIEELNVPLLDYRSLAGIENDSFRDPIHLNESGRRVLTRQLVTDLIPLLKE
jgi:hypothetical protein